MDHKLNAARALAAYVADPTHEAILPDALDKSVADVIDMSIQ
jgi:hypothetical protein